MFNLVLNAAKNTNHRKKVSNKSCSEFNFVQKSPRAHVSIPTRVELGAGMIDMAEV